MNPELPALSWDDCFWEGELLLPSWRGFQSRRGPYGAISSDVPSDGCIRIRFIPDKVEKVAPTAEQVAAYKWLVEHETTIATTVQRAVFVSYPQFREDYIDAYDGEDAQIAAQSAPTLDQPEELRFVMGVYALFVLPISKDGVGYIGFECGCVWDEEHGLGVMTYKDRVIDIGDASTAFNFHRAREDAARE